MNKLLIWFVAVCLQLSILAPAQPAFAISVELAKKCRDMAIKSHPPTLPGTSPYAQAERDFFNACVKQNGNMSDDDAPKTPPPPKN